MNIPRHFVHCSRNTHSAAFVDFKRVILKAGHGGDGCIAFARSVYQPMGPPCGGNGGSGASIFIRSSAKIDSLNGMQSTVIAASGVDGSNKSMHGANARDIEIVVPVGTVVKSLMNPKDDDRNTHLDRGDESDQLALVRKYFKFRHKYVPQQDRIEMLVDRIPLPEPVREVDFDLSEDGMRMLLVRGGTGGLGNPHFVTPLMPGPGIAMLGSEGETMTINLELKTIADAGLVGLPNAGKSSLLAAVSNAHPKIAAYAFTTLNPYVGTIEYADFWTMTIADMPGIIHDAHLNKGLGHRFLRHIERNRILVYVIDIAGPEPWKDFAVLQDELEAYKPGLSNRPSIIAANKADLEPARANLEILKSKTQLVIVPISAKEQKNIITLTSLMRTMLNSVK